MVLSFRGIYGSKVVIIEEDTDVEGEVGVSVGVWKTGITRGAGGDEGVDRLGKSRG